MLLWYFRMEGWLCYVDALQCHDNSLWFYGVIDWLDSVLAIFQPHNSGCYCAIS